MRNPRHFNREKGLRLWDGSMWWLVKDGNCCITVSYCAPKDHPPSGYVDINPRSFNMSRAKGGGSPYVWVAGRESAPVEWVEEMKRIGKWG